MAKLSNVSNFEALFRSHLVTVNASSATIRNYISDFNHYYGWLNGKLEMKGFKSEVEEVQRLFSSELFSQYILYQKSVNTPIGTINRRLSTLRKWCSLCISQGWMKENPAKKISNQIKKTVFPVSKKIANQSTVTEESILNEFISENKPTTASTKYVNEFLSIIFSTL